MELNKCDVIIIDEGAFIRMIFHSDKAKKVLSKKPEMKRNIKTNPETNEQYLILDNGYLYPMKHFCKVNELELFEF